VVDTDIESLRALRLAARALVTTLLTLAVTGVLGCGAATRARPASTRNADAIALERYVTAIEPLRLAVNRLLQRADPILNAFRARRISGPEAARRMGDLELGFAAYAVEVNALRPDTAKLRSLQAEYARTYVLEDAYLSALVAGLRQHELSGLPRTAGGQRAAVIAWRIGLMVLARQDGVALPVDLQQAGRGEIAPSPEGS
jgi:hypothetical protein